MLLRCCTVGSDRGHALVRARHASDPTLEWFAGRSASRGSKLQAHLLKRVAAWTASSIMSLLQPSIGFEDVLDGPLKAPESLQHQNLGDARIAAKVCLAE